MREVYYTDFSGWEPPAARDADRLAAGLSDERKRRIRSFRSDEKRLQSLAAGLLLDYGLKRHGLSERTAQIRRSPHGKPFLAVETGLYFNLSHSGTCALLALSDRACGCDIQKLSRADRRVCARILAGEEAEYLERFAEGTERDRAFTGLWTRKESFVKMTGEGLSRPLSGFLTLPGRTPEGSAIVTWHFPGYAASACFPEETGTAAPHLVFCPFQKLADVVS